MTTTEIHANSCLPELLYGVPVQCQTHTRVYVNAALCACTSEHERSTRTSEASTGHKGKPGLVFVLMSM